jgi:hypothetical protein
MSDREQLFGFVHGHKNRFKFHRHLSVHLRTGNYLYAQSKHVDVEGMWENTPPKPKSPRGSSNHSASNPGENKVRAA